LLPFTRAILQSPAIKPATDAANYALLHTQLLQVAGVSSVNAARGLGSAQLQQVNRDMVASAAFASTHFGKNEDLHA
jgi:hypothetical protein